MLYNIHTLLILILEMILQFYFRKWSGVWRSAWYYSIFENFKWMCEVFIDALDGQFSIVVRKVVCLCESSAMWMYYSEFEIKSESNSLYHHLLLSPVYPSEYLYIRISNKWLSTSETHFVWEKSLNKKIKHFSTGKNRNIFNDIVTFNIHKVMRFVSVVGFIFSRS